MRIYEKLGFEIADEMVLGKGKADNDGNLCKGGEGVKIWGMVWWPEGLKKKVAGGGGENANRRVKSCAVM